MIIGLVVGGVLVGQYLIKSAELRSLLAEKDRYEKAVNTFRLKFDCLPGDCNNASSYLTGAYNGDGNNMIGFFGSGASAVLAPYEFVGIWQHLALAGLIADTGNYNPSLTPTPNTNVTMTPGYNCPFSIRNTCPVVFYAPILNTLCGEDFTQAYYQYWQNDNGYGDCNNGDKGMPVLAQGHVIQYGYGINDNGGSPMGVLNGAELLSIDQKIDDGKPQSGIVQTNPIGNYPNWQSQPGWNGTYNPCLINPNTGQEPIVRNAASNYGVVVYNTLATDRVCQVIFDTSF